MTRVRLKQTLASPMSASFFQLVATINPNFISNWYLPQILVPKCSKHLHACISALLFQCYFRCYFCFYFVAQNCRQNELRQFIANTASEQGAAKEARQGQDYLPVWNGSYFLYIVSGIILIKTRCLHELHSVHGFTCAFRTNPSSPFYFGGRRTFVELFLVQKMQEIQKTHDGESFESAESTKPSEWWLIMALNLLHFPSVLWRCEIISVRAHKRFETLLRGSRRKTVRKIKKTPNYEFFFRSQEHKPLPPTMSNFLFIGGRRIFFPRDCLWVQFSNWWVPGKSLEKLSPCLRCRYLDLLTISRSCLYVTIAYMWTMGQKYPKGCL